MSSRAGATGTPYLEMRDGDGRFLCRLRMGTYHMLSGARWVYRVSRHPTAKLMIFIAVVTAVTGVTTSCIKRSGLYAQKHVLASKCPAVKEVRNALQRHGYQGILLAVQGLNCSGISTGEEIQVALGQRFTRDPSSMQFVLRTGKMTPNQVGESLLATPYRLVDKLCAIEHEIDKRRQVVKTTFSDTKIKSILLQMLRADPEYEKSVCEKNSNSEK